MKKVPNNSKDHFSLQQKKSRYSIKPQATQELQQNFNSANFNNAE